MRALRPEHLFVLESGLWAVDAVQPVAVVLDPGGRGVRAVVSWAQLPPAPVTDPWTRGRLPRVLSDGTSLWVQQQGRGPLVRVDLDGAAAAAWTDGLGLAACGPGVAWCAPPPPSQELVEGADARPSTLSGLDRLLRVDAAGRATPVLIDARVRSVQAEADALLVQVDVAGWRLRHLGLDTYEVVRRTRWLSLPWDAEVPSMLTRADHGLAQGSAPSPRWDDGGRGPFAWYDPDPPPDPVDPVNAVDPAAEGVLAGGLRWHLGWPRDVPTGHADEGGRRQVVASASRPDGRTVRRWELGAGAVRAATPLGDRLAIVVDRSPRWPPGALSQVDVVALDPDTADLTVLIGGGGVDITDRCWPLVDRPLETDSYTAQVLAAHSAVPASRCTTPAHRGGPVEGRPITDGMGAVRVASAGNWPSTQLEWTFTFDPYPGLLLRRRVPLFDELGRPFPPEHADIHLMEDLDTRGLPAASAARNGVLDV